MQDKRKRSTFRGIAKDAGLNPVVCTHCGRKVRTDALIDNLWAKLKQRLKEGDSVSIKHFGSFVVKLLKPRKFNEAQREALGVEGFDARNVIRFQQSRDMPEFLNQGKEDGDER
jgi:nucleoid DNA-binding protein